MASSGNFGTWNPLNIGSGGSTSLTVGNTNAVMTGADPRTAANVGGVISDTDGYYFETVATSAGSGALTLGIINEDRHNQLTSGQIHSRSGSFMWRGYDGGAFFVETSSNTSYGTFTDGDVLGWYVKNSKLYVKKNNSDVVGDVVNTSGGIDISGGFFFPAVSRTVGGGAQTSSILRTDSDDWSYSPPEGFKGLTSKDMVITEEVDPAQDAGPNTHFDVVTYTGNGSTQSITSLGFQPDWTLIKNRSTGDWCNQNSSLGVGKSQKWNDDGGVSSDTDAVTSFNSDGFSLGADSKVNTSSANYVAYCWKKSAEAGLDIVTYSGGGGSQAVSHSLGVTPDCIFIMLNTGTALDSIMYLNSASMGTSYGIFPTLANARQNTTYVSATTSSNFTVTGSADTSGRTYFAYVLKSIAGFSRFGQYYANANTNGPFTYLGFRPRLVIIKALESGQTWFFFDTARSTHNVIDLYLYGQRDLAESTAGTIDIDFLSNGFKIRSSGSDLNSSSGQAYAYLAWADVPFKYNNTF